MPQRRWSGAGDYHGLLLPLQPIRPYRCCDCRHHHGDWRRLLRGPIVSCVVRTLRLVGRRRVHGSKVRLSLLIWGGGASGNGKGNVREKGHPCPRLRIVGAHEAALWPWMCERTLSARVASLLRLLRPDLDPSTIRPLDRAHGIPVNRFLFPCQK